MSNGTLIASISGIRGIVGNGLDPSVLVRYASAYGTWAHRRAVADGRSPLIVVGRDARRSGPVCASIVMSTLQGMGCDVIDAGLATTPTVEMAVIEENAAGGIILSASHNPEEWNALKLLNERGEFLTPAEGEAVMQIADREDTDPAGVDALGTLREHDFLDMHVSRILDLDAIDADVIAGAGLTAVVDGVNSVGGVALPRLLHELGVEVIELNCEPTGRFAHPAEPRPQHLKGLTQKVKEEGADIGLAVDPDADRLALVDDQGRFILEELTQVIAADFWWQHHDGPFVTNLSSSRAIEDVATKYGQEVHRSAVGEINVVMTMRTSGAVLGGEGNGGVIVPDLHYGRDALAGAAIVLQHLATSGKTLAEIHDSMPSYEIAKDKLPLPDLDVDALLTRMATKYEEEDLSAVDGLKIDFPDSWVHMRPSNTEPILRVYAEASTVAKAQALADRFKQELSDMIG
ncbi:phosphoglucosamine mutase [Longibacter salinarum]|uniref:Phosphoglucosamine mutase n=1 Tax=Longibacter salinarum TaxID=1850348 RepID=A0A2A8D170_9BACT|nr:phosphoglucosamine mutase [Longibacter salinarum]PEN14553.1 phosphoglucosamine mutase [Longibacter salinarum]